MKRFDKNYLIYGCASKEKFESIKEERDNFNYKVWTIVSSLAIVYFIVLFLTTFSLEVVKVNAVVDLALAALVSLNLILLRTVAKPGSKMFLPVVYFICTLLFVFSIIIGAALSPRFLAVTFHVLLIGLPLLIVDRPYRMSLLEMAVTAVFIAFCCMFKSGETRQLDIYNAVMFFGLSQYVNYYMSIAKMKQFLFARKMEVSSLTDELTQLNNRKAYEDDIVNYPDVPPEADFVYVSIDVNELKIANDTLGHNAGDELLKGAAECIRRCLGPYGKAYRIGGDEFAAILFANEERLEEIKKDFQTSVWDWSGEENDHLSVAVGYVTKREFPQMTVVEMAKIADQRMYGEKANHYSKKGVDRRGRQAAHTALCELYTKILKINLSEDSFQVINMDLAEQTEEKGYSMKISEWLYNFAASGQVHPDDFEAYCEKTNLDFLKEYFQGQKTSISIFYRRRYGEEYKQVMMEMIPANDYSDENQTLFLYVKSIDK